MKKFATKREHDVGISELCLLGDIAAVSNLIENLKITSGSASEYARKASKNSAIISAIKNGNPELVFLLLSNSFNPNLRVANGDSCLHVATKLASTSPSDICTIVRHLIHFGADVNMINGENESVMDIAISSNSIELIKLLLSNGAIVMSENSKSKLSSILNPSNRVAGSESGVALGGDADILRQHGYDIRRILAAIDARDCCDTENCNEAWRNQELSILGLEILHRDFKYSIVKTKSSGKTYLIHLRDPFSIEDHAGNKIFP